MDNSKIQNLPILKHFEDSEIGKSVNSFRKGEKGMFNLFKLLLLGAVLYFSWVYVLPPVFQAIGQTLAIVSTGIIIVAVVMMLPLILKAIRRFTRFCHKALIKHDPFGELEEQRGKMAQNKKHFQKAKGKITHLKNDMEISADESEKKAKKLETKIITLKQKADTLKGDMDTMVKNGGAAAKGTDDYVHTHSEYLKTVSDASRKSHELEQEKDFVRKYGSRAAVMKKLSQKLLMVETSMDIKILDFDATIDILKKDYAFAQKSREATESAKSVLGMTTGWELEYALDVVTTTIAEDIAVTAGNLNDIDTLTSTYAMDSDELYANLSVVADNIKIGKDPIASAKDYSNPEYKLTHEDRLKSGGFGDVF
jgi:ElaB/YqjD/DUF883 family membrane-anchored ribosome-binding protein